MEDLYKAALRNLRTHKTPVFNGLEIDWIYKTFEKIETKVLPADNSNQSTKENYYQEEQEIGISEKKQVLESFTQFSSDKLEEVESIKFKGGEVTISETANSKGLDHSGYLCNDSDEFLKLQSELFGKAYSESRFGAKNLNSGGQTKVMFISDVFIEKPDETEAQDLKELVCFFDEGVASLFEKMITAMGLGVGDYVISALHFQKDESKLLRDNLMNEILFFKPEYIVTLGAKAVNELLGTHKRLKNIHGQFFDLKVKDQNGMISESRLMPLFSPKLLHIAPNMKQTAWKDMQKLMEKFEI